jgi:hypothetical protein
VLDPFDEVVDHVPLVLREMERVEDLDRQLRAVSANSIPSASASVPTARHAPA